MMASMTDQIATASSDDVKVILARADADHARAELIKARAEHVDTELMLISEENKATEMMLAHQYRFYVGVFIVAMSTIAFAAAVILLPMYI